MAGSSGGTTPGGKKKARIEIIPLIDVIFFLLATFVLFTLSLNSTKGIRVDLPPAKTSVSRNPANTVTVTMTKDGAIGWNKDGVQPDQFLEKLRQLQSTAPDTRVLINADADASYAQVYGYLLQQIRAAGVKIVYMETRTKTE